MCTRCALEKVHLVHYFWFQAIRNRIFCPGKEIKMIVQVAKTILINHRQDYNRDRLPWLPARLYRSFREARQGRKAR